MIKIKQKNLGSATVIATDKTGTLTMNEMTVESIWCDGQIESLNFMNVNMDFVIESKTWRKMIKVAAICNKAILQKKDETLSIRINPQKTSDKEREYFDFATPGLSNSKDIKARDDEDFPSSVFSNQKDGLSNSKNIKKKEDQDFASPVFSNQKEGLSNSKNIKKKEDEDFPSPAFSKEMNNYEKNNQILNKPITKKDKLLQERKYLQKFCISDLVGEPLEKALLFFSHCFRDFGALRQKNEKIYELPFNSVNKFQFSAHKKKKWKNFGGNKGCT